MTAYRDYLCDPILTSWTKISETKNKWLFIRLHIYLMYWRVCWWPVEVWWFKRLDSWIGCFHEKCWQGTFESMQKIILYFLNNVLRIHRVVPFTFLHFLYMPTGFCLMDRLNLALLSPNFEHFSSLLKKETCGSHRDWTRSGIPSWSKPCFEDWRS